MSIAELKDGRAPVRHIVSLDGTWQRGEQEHPTNIKLLHDALSDLGTDGMLQNKVYFDGGGTKGSYLIRMWNGLAGADLDDRIIEAYEHLCKNYKPGDDIALVGFSRGAFTARSLNGMIYKCGILKDTDNLKKTTREAYNFYRDGHHPKSNTAKNFRAENSYQECPKINLACFETVGELGVPKQLLFFSPLSHCFNKFHDTKLNENTIVAIHALSIDEQRVNLQHTPMTCDESCSTNFQRAWFAGDHNSIGGGNKEDRPLSDISGLWMANKLTELISIGYKQEVLSNVFHPDPTANPESDFKLRARSWPWKLARLQPRVLPEGAPLHPSVLERIIKVSSYNPENLNGHIKAALAKKAYEPINLLPKSRFG